MSDNIHVAIRIRPLIKREVDSNAEIYWGTKDSTVIYQKNCPSSLYCFDRVFNTEEDNALIYRNLCAPIVQSVMQGFNGTIFAYGQTSSGKTYTMMGEDGIIPSAIHDIFDAIDNMPEREFLLRVSYMEIYNENVLDLLSRETKNLKTLEDTDGVILVVGLEEEEIKTSEEVFRIMKRGERKRRVGDTQMNEKSSRSHAIFRMIVESRMRNDTEDSVVNVGQLNLVDLAGSERSGQMGITGERFREGININKSLLMLTHVISQLSKGDKQHVGYRDSKLTRILQNSLGGNARTVIICTVTPASIQETHSTLKFASRAKRIKNKPTANIVSNDKALLKRYTNEIRKLSEKLEALQQQGDDGKKEILEKELKEKSKQNEDLKQQIQELKEKFVVSQLTTDRPNPVLNKKSRRETWCAGLSGRMRLSTQADSLALMNPLPILQEEPLNSSFLSSEVFDFDFVTKDRKSSVISPSMYDFQYSLYKAGIEASVQTEESYAPKEDTLLQILQTTQAEYEALKEFTTQEKQAQEVHNAEELKMLKVRNQELEIKVTEYDALLQENHKQRNRLNDLTNQIEKLEEKILESQLANAEQSTLPSSGDEMSLFQELSKCKDFLDVSVQVQDIEAMKQVDEKIVQTETLAQALEISTQTEDVFIKNSQEQFVQVKMRNQTMETAAQTNDDFIEEFDRNTMQFSEEERDLTKAIHLVDFEDVKLNKQAIQDILSELTMLSEEYRLICNDVTHFDVSSFNNSLVDDLPLDEKNLTLSKLINQTIQLKHEQVVQELECAIQDLKMEDENRMMQIKRLENMCKDKDQELRLVSENIDNLKRQISLKENELATWREKASEKYDLHLKMFKENRVLQKQLKEMERAVSLKEKLVKDLTEKVESNENALTKLQEELCETIKALEIAKQERAIEKDHLNSANELHELDKDKLHSEISMLKEQHEAYVQHYKDMMEEVKSGYENKLAILKGKVKKDEEEKLTNLEQDLRNKHILELEDVKENLNSELLKQLHTFKLEKLKFEEELFKSNREYMKKNSAYLSMLKHDLSTKEDKYQKLKITMQNLALKDSNGPVGLDSISELKGELEAKKKELKAVQKKLEISEKALMDLKSGKHIDTESYQKLEKKNTLLENLVKDRENAIKHHSLKFSSFKTEFEQEYVKLKTERDTLSQKVNQLEKEMADTKHSSSTKDPLLSADKNQVPGSILKVQENGADSSLASTEITFEKKQLQHRCKKLEQERDILLQKLSLCKNEIRRLHDQNNVSKVDPKPTPDSKSSLSAAGSGIVNTVNNMHLQTLLHQKEKCIKKLEKENRKYQEYLKSKGHHKIVDEVAKEQVGSGDGSSNLSSNPNTPASIKTPLPTSAVKMTSPTPATIKTHRPTSAVKMTSSTPLLPSSTMPAPLPSFITPKMQMPKMLSPKLSTIQKSPSISKSAASEYDDKNCKQQ